MRKIINNRNLNITKKEEEVLLNKLKDVFTIEPLMVLCKNKVFFVQMNNKKQFELNNISLVV